MSDYLVTHAVSNPKARHLHKTMPLNFHTLEITSKKILLSQHKNNLEPEDEPTYVFKSKEERYASKYVPKTSSPLSPFQEMQLEISTQ